MRDPLTILVAARDEEERIGRTVRALREAFPEAEVIVADDGSRDGTADAAEEAGAVVLRLQRRGKGQALSEAERAAPPGRLLLADADLAGDLRPLADSDADLVVAAFAVRHGGGFGIAKRTGRALVRALSGFEPREPLSGQRALSARARSACFPLAPGFGCEVRGTIDAVRAGLRVEEVELELEHRATGRDLRGFLHRGRQLADALLACGPLRENHRGQRVGLTGPLLLLGPSPAVSAICAIGLADDLWSGPERGFRAHLAAGRTTGVAKLVGIPLVGLLATRRLSGALLVGLAANALNQLDTKPGRALKAFLLLGAGGSRWYAGSAVLLAPYDLREMAMLGDAGANALGAVLGLRSVHRLGSRSRWSLVGALAALTLYGERRSIGAAIERTPVLREIDSWGRVG